MGESNVLGLVEGVYAAAVNPTGWPDLLRQLSDVLEGHSACLLYHDPATPRGRVEAAYRLDPAAAVAYGEYFGARDPWAMTLKARKALTSGLVSTGEAVLDQSSLRKTEYYTDYARHYGISQNVFAIDLDPASGAGFVLTILRPDSAGAFDASAVQVLSALRPHIHRGFQVHARLSEASLAQRTSEAALERLSVGVLLFDSSCRMTFANAAARAICSKKDGLTLQPHSVCAARRDEHAVLRDAVNRAARTGNGYGMDAGAQVRISRPSGGRPLTVIVSPLPIADESHGGSAAVAFVADPDRTVQIGSDLLTTTYGLTRAETIVCERLASGGSLREVAAELTITVETARTHLKRILNKTGTHRQAELIRLLLTMLPT